ncbi:MAG: hypothetical protein EOP05_20140, partial [Proteobacteria bacterium]
MIQGFSQLFKSAVLALAPSFLVFGAISAHAETRVALKSAVEVDSAKTEITLSDLVVAKGLSR